MEETGCGQSCQLVLFFTWTYVGLPHEAQAAQGLVLILGLGFAVSFRKK